MSADFEDCILFASGYYYRVDDSIFEDDRRYLEGNYYERSAGPEFLGPDIWLFFIGDENLSLIGLLFTFLVSFIVLLIFPYYGTIEFLGLKNDFLADKFFGEKVSGIPIYRFYFFKADLASENFARSPLNRSKNTFLLGVAPLNQLAFFYTSTFVEIVEIFLFWRTLDFIFLYMST